MAPRRRRRGEASAGEAPRSDLRDERAAIQERPRFHLLYLLFAVLVVVLVHDLWVAARDVDRIPYSHFRELLEQGKVDEVVIQGDSIRGVLKQPENGKERFVTQRGV